MTASTFIGTQKNYHLSLSELNTLVTDSEYLKSLDLRWIKDYCKINNIGLILPLISPKSPESLAQLITGLYHVEEAFKQRKIIAQIKSGPKKHAKNEIVYAEHELPEHVSLFNIHVREARNAQNFLATYLYLVDLIYNFLPSQPIAKFIAAFKPFEENDLACFDNVGTLADFFKAHIYAYLADVLSQKNNVQASNIIGTELGLFKANTNNKNATDQYSLKALTKLGEFNKMSQFIDPFTVNCILNSPDLVPGNTIAEKVNTLQNFIYKSNHVEPPKRRSTFLG